MSSFWYTPGNLIKFMPGFNAKPGSSVIASIDPLLEQSPYYCKINVDPCNGGTFEPLRVDYKKAVFPVVEHLPQFPDSIWQVENKTIMESLFSDVYNEKLLNIELPELGTETFTVFPNPTSGIFKVNIPDKTKLKSMEIRSYAGQIIYTCKFTDESIIEFDLSAHKAGVYFVNIRTDYSENRLKVVKY